jgi:hypothetical protein
MLVTSDERAGADIDVRHTDSTDTAPSTACTVDAGIAPRLHNP